jgi:hypothetical protein
MLKRKNHCLFCESHKKRKYTVGEGQYFNAEVCDVFLRCFYVEVVHRVLVGKPGRKRPVGRPKRRWEDNIKMDLREVEGG